MARGPRPGGGATAVGFSSVQHGVGRDLGDAREEDVHLLGFPTDDEEPQAHDVGEGRARAGETARRVAQRVGELTGQVPRRDAIRGGVPRNLPATCTCLEPVPIATWWYGAGWNIPSGVTSCTVMSFPSVLTSLIGIREILGV